MKRKIGILLIIIIFLMGCKQESPEMEEPVETPGINLDVKENESTPMRKEVGVNEIKNSYQENAIYHVNFPHVQETVLNEAVDQFVDGKIQEFLEESREYDEKNSEFFNEFHMDYESWAVQQYINIKFRYQTYLQGYAHPVQGIKTIVFDKEKNKVVSLEEILGTVPITEVREALSEKLKGMEKGIIIEEKELSELPLDNFLCENDTIHILLNPSTVFAGSEGIIDVSLSRSQLIDEAVQKEETERQKAEAEKRQQEEEEAKRQAEEQRQKEEEEKRQAEEQRQKEEAEKKAEETSAPESSGDKVVALTFDDGPSESTKTLLDILKEENVKATFFLLGVQVPGREDIVKRMYDEGHMIGNHSYDHKQFTLLSGDEIGAQIRDTDALISNITGESPKVFRPPYGAYNSDVLSLVDKGCILWDVDPEDWRSRDAEAIYQSVISQVQDGSIVLSHDIYESTVEAYRKIIPKLKEMGYRIVTVEELLSSRGKTLESHQIYNSGR